LDAAGSICALFLTNNLSGLCNKQQVERHLDTQKTPASFIPSVSQFAKDALGSLSITENPKNENIVTQIAGRCAFRLREAGTQKEVERQQRVAITESDQDDSAFGSVKSMQTKPLTSLPEDLVVAILKTCCHVTLSKVSRVSRVLNFIISNRAIWQSIMVVYFGHSLVDHARHVPPSVVSGIDETFLAMQPSELAEAVEAEILGEQEAFPTTRRMAEKRSNFEGGESVSCQYRDGNWFDAHLETVQSDGNFVVSWDDGDKSDTIKGVMQLRRCAVSSSNEVVARDLAVHTHSRLISSDPHSTTPHFAIVTDWKHLFRFYFSHSWLSLCPGADNEQTRKLTSRSQIAIKMAQHNAAAFCGCTSVAADSDMEGAHIWQNLSKKKSGDCCAVSGNNEEAEFISGYNTGIHYWKILSRVCEHCTGCILKGGSKEFPPSFASGIVTGDRKPGKIFLDSEPARRRQECWALDLGTSGAARKQ